MNTSENKRTNMSDETDRKWKGLYLTSGILMFLIALLSFIVAWSGRTLYAQGYPADPEAYLNLVSQHQGLANFTWSLWIVLDFIGLPPIIALYILLQRYNRSLALLGGLFLIFYAIYDVGVTELNSLALVSLSSGYAIATTEAARASFVSAATYGYYALPLQTVLSFAIGPVGYILFCVPMARSFFGRWTATIGIIVSVIGLLGAAAPVIPSSYFLGLCQFLCVRLIALWTILLGVQLLRYALRLPAGMSKTTIVS
jgi:hypothetical protein